MHRTPDPAIGAIFTHTARLVALFATTRHPTPTAIGVGQTLVAILNINEIPDLKDIIE